LAAGGAEPKIRVGGAGDGGPAQGWSREDTVMIEEPSPGGPTGSASRPAPAGPGPGPGAGDGPPPHDQPAGGPLRPLLLGAVVGALVGAVAAGGIVAAVDDSGGSTVTKVISQPPATQLARPSTQLAGNDIATIVNQAEPSVVAITVNGGPTSSNGAAGTGFVISPDGYVATNNHVVEGANRIQVQFTNGRTVDARLVGRDPSTDLAVVKVDGTGLPAAQLGSSDGAQIGDSVVAIGNALALQGGLTVTNGIISGKNRQVPEQTGAVLFGMLQTDAAINPGNSGGPLLDSQGRVIGINTAVANTAQNIGFAIPISKAIPVFDDLRSGRKPAFLGVSTQDLTPQIASQLNVSVTQGAVVTQVSSGTPAATAGVRKNDVIVQLDNTPITAASDLQTAIRSHQPGQTVSVVVVRGSQRLTLSARLSTRPDPTG